jgi:hypothetical protein
MRVNREGAGAFALALSLCLVTGCGGGKTNVKGKVTYQGKTVVWGTVTLVDNTGANHQGTIELDGTYSVPDVPRGSVKIGVFSRAPSNRPRPDGGKGVKTVDPNDPRSKFKKNPDIERPLPAPGQWFPIPEKYSDAHSSGLTGEVQSGTLDIKLE